MGAAPIGCTAQHGRRPWLWSAGAEQPLSRPARPTKRGHPDPAPFHCVKLRSGRLRQWFYCVRLRLCRFRQWFHCWELRSGRFPVQGQPPMNDPAVPTSKAVGRLPLLREWRGFCGGSGYDERVGVPTSELANCGALAIPVEPRRFAGSIAKIQIRAVR